MTAFGTMWREGAASRDVPGRRARKASAVALFVLATSVGAYVAVPVPWSPVPMTLQPLVVLLAGAVLGPALGGAAMALYLAIGAMGAPVFSGGGAGLLWLAGPTGGYLIAFPAVAVAVGLVAGERGSGATRLLIGLAAGLAVMYLGGLAQLALITGVPTAELLAIGVLPFVTGDLIKVLVAFLVARSFRPTSLGRF